MAASQTAVEYRRLGECGLRVSVPIIGGGSFGSRKWFNWVLDEEKSFEVLKAAWDEGVTTIDTANNYSNGESEIIIGKFLKKYSIPRHRVIILTKCFNLVNDEGVRAQEHPHLKDSRNYVNQSGLSRAAIFNQIEGSLERLQVSYIDMLQLHRFDPDTPVEETMKALHDLVQSGKVRYLGGTSMRCWQFAKMNEVARRNGWTPFVSMQCEYSLLYRENVRFLLMFCWNSHEAKPLIRNAR